MSREALVVEALSEALGDRTDVAFQPAGGGCINEAAIAVRGDETFFVKWDGPP